MEALGLIHDLGKLSDRFLESRDPSVNLEYEYSLLADPRLINTFKAHTPVPNDSASKFAETILEKASNMRCAFQERTDLTSVLEKAVFRDWSGRTYNFAELAPLGTKPSLAVGAADWHRVFGKEMEPGRLVGMLHGCAHFEKEGEPNANQQPYIQVFRASPFGLEEKIGTISSHELNDALKALPLENIEMITGEHRHEWLAQMKLQMSRGLADNRRPHNEVSLWDWGFTVAALTKAGAAYIFKYGWPNELGDLAYRTLGINLDILECFTRCDKITDLLGVQMALGEAFLRVKCLLEENYALGNCIYQDETGLYFLLPDVLDDEGLSALRREIQAGFEPDLRPHVHLGEPITAGQLDRKLNTHDPDAVARLVSKPRSKALSEAPTQTDNNLYLFEAEWTEGRPANAEICMACGVRPVGYPIAQSLEELEGELAAWATQEKAEQRHICRVCLGRRGRRAQQWTEEGLTDTIWTNEVADEHGRLALFVGKLDLDDWLEGSLFSTLLVKNKTKKSPSPARLYRVVETTRKFWEDVTNRLMPTIVGKHALRLALYPQPDCVADLGAFHAYEGTVGGVSLSLVWDKPNQRFLTAENLSYGPQRSGIDLAEVIHGGLGDMLQILEPSTNAKVNRPLVEARIERVEKLDGYLPAIPILAEPSLCLMLVPANHALDLVNAVKDEYQGRMGRVRDRLPLHLGLVFCHRRTPIRAVLEAGKAMLNMDHGGKWEGWRLKKKEGPLASGQRLLFDNGISWNIPIFAGDGITKDLWYPRMYEGERFHDAKTMHVSDLRERPPNIPTESGWKVWVRPSRFDFEFLDTHGRRFEIHYDAEGRRPRRTRPFYLEDLDRFEVLWGLMKRLAVSQRHKVIQAIEDTREAWYGVAESEQAGADPVFRQFVADRLAVAEWPKSQPWRNLTSEERNGLVEAGVRGELADLAELHMEILKER